METMSRRLTSLAMAAQLLMVQGDTDVVWDAVEPGTPIEITP
jgi:hypothetical protein